MKKVMILGAGKNQLPIINICNKRGYYTIVVSVEGDYPGFALANKSYYFDTKDKNAILRAAKEEKIDAILTDQTDVAVPTVAYVAEQMGLRGIGYETALKFTNKYLMRKSCKDAGIVMPEFYNVYTLEDALDCANKIKYPVIIKPVDSSGSRGVRKINNGTQLIEYFSEAKKYSETGNVIIEKFIDGIPYIVNGFAMNNEFQALDIGIKNYFDIPDTRIPSMCMFSSVRLVSGIQEEKVIEMNQSIVKALGLPFGITHADYLYCPKDGVVYLVEIAARGGGDFISSNLTPLACGFNTNEALIDYVVNGKETFPKINELKSNVSGYISFALPNGIIRNIMGVEECKRIPGVYDIILKDLYEGKEVYQITDNTGKYGLVLFCSSSRDECKEIIKSIKKMLKIEVETEKGVQNIIW